MSVMNTSPNFFITFGKMNIFINKLILLIKALHKFLNKIQNVVIVVFIIALSITLL